MTNLILITGLPASGKTTLASKIADEFKLPLITKDTIKEIIFDKLGWNDRGWSKKVGIASYALMDYIIEEHLKSGQDLIVESNFKPEFDNQKFQQWQSKYNYRAVQILCSADRNILFQRFCERVEKGERHPGHVDGNNLDEFRERLAKDEIEALDIQGETIQFDTTDFENIDYDHVLKNIHSVLNK